MPRLPIHRAASRFALAVATPRLACAIALALGLAAAPSPAEEEVIDEVTVLSAPPDLPPAGEPLPFPDEADAFPDGDEDLFASFSDELLVPENPFVFPHSVTLWNGARSDELDAGLGTGDYDFYELGLDGEFHWGRVNLRSSVDFGWDGNHDAESFDFGIGAGYDFDLTVTGIQLTPILGYRTSHLDQEGRFESEWEGAFAGLQLEVPLHEKWTLRASYFHHWADFEAKLAAARPAPRLNRVEDASGHTASFDLIHEVNERIDLKLGAQLDSFSSAPTPLSGRDAEWESWSVRVGVSVRF